MELEIPYSYIISRKRSQVRYLYAYPSMISRSTYTLCNGAAKQGTPTYFPKMPPKVRVFDSNENAVTAFPIFALTLRTVR